MDKCQGFVLNSDGSTKAITKLSSIFGARFVKRVGHWLVLCGANGARNPEECCMIDAFIEMIVNEHVKCHSFPVFVYMGSSTLQLK